MIDRHCEYCEKELCAGNCMVSIKDGNRTILVHRDCVPYMSGGVLASEIEKKCDVEIIGEVDVGGSGNIRTYRFGTNKLHNEYGPAVEWPDRTKEWFIDGQLHRTDGPAIEHANGSREWYIDGKCHRDNGPACERHDGSKFWFIDGKRHRLDGPAVERANGSKLWFIDGKHFIEQEFRERIKKRDKT